MTRDDLTTQTAIREMTEFMQRIYARDAKPIHESRLINFLKERLPHELILRAIEIAEREGCISRRSGTTIYTPTQANPATPLAKVIEAVAEADAAYIRGARLDDPARLHFYTTIEHYWGLIYTTLQAAARTNSKEPK